MVENGTNITITVNVNQSQLNDTTRENTSAATAESITSWIILGVMFLCCLICCLKCARCCWDRSKKNRDKKKKRAYGITPKSKKEKKENKEFIKKLETLRYDIEQASKEPVPTTNEAIIFLGNTGSGKSSTLNWMSGCDYELAEGARGLRFLKLVKG